MSFFQAICAPVRLPETGMSMCNVIPRHTTAWKTAILTCFVLFSTVGAWGQASVPENQESIYVYVAVTGSDSNPGTASAPFRTITKAVNVAVANNLKNIGTRVTVNAGMYREGNITLWAVSGQTNAPITVEAATPGTVTMSGADVWTGWAVDPQNTQIFTHLWPYKWGLCSSLASSEEEIVRRREMIFVNGTKLTQVLSFSQMVQGTFFADETNSVVYIWPQSGINISNATVEVSVRPELFEIHEKTNWVLRGITFEYANGCRQIQPAVTFAGNSSNILIDNDKFLWNNAGGLSFNSTIYTTAQNSVANHNGETGMIARQAKYSLYESDEASYNNWRGAQGAFYGVQAAGGKFMSIHNGTVQGFKAFFNVAKGVHWDTDNVNVKAGSLDISNSLWSALQIEATQGPVTISNSLLCNNNLQNSPYNGAVALLDASYVTLTGNTLYDNANSQIYIGGRPGGIAVTTYETGATLQVFNEHVAASNNVIEGTGSQQLFHDGLNVDWPLFASTLTSDYNTWWNPNTTNPLAVPVPTIYTYENLPSWRTLTKQDSHSTYAAPAVSPSTSCQVTPDATDFWFIVGPNSASATTIPGGKALYTVSVVPLAFSGPVSLHSSIPIPGGSGSFSPASINTSGSSTLTVTTSSSTPLGTYYITMTATDGSMARTITVPLVVN